MPILLPHLIKNLPQQAFNELDYDVMALAFEVHNELGRFYDERIYQNALAEKCLNKGLQVELEFEVKLSHQTYTKHLFTDLLIENSVYELKTIQSIQETQRTQHRNHLLKLLQHTPFQYLYWINLNHSEISFTTLTK